MEEGFKITSSEAPAGPLFTYQKVKKAPGMH
jgi:hypothetical protein